MLLIKAKLQIRWQMPSKEVGLRSNTQQNHDSLIPNLALALALHGHRRLLAAKCKQGCQGTIQCHGPFVGVPLPFVFVHKTLISTQSWFSLRLRGIGFGGGPKAFGALCVVPASNTSLLLSHVPGARQDDSIPDCSTKARNRPRQAFPFLVSDYSLQFQGITCLGAGRGQCPFPSCRLFLFPWVPSFPSLCLHGILRPQTAQVEPLSIAGLCPSSALGGTLPNHRLVPGTWSNALSCWAMTL